MSGRMGSRGLRLNSFRIYGKCCDCRKKSKLTGHLCKVCYNKRYRRQLRQNPEWVARERLRLRIFYAKHKKKK